ncbi:MAG: hypothetical protein GC179_27890 [Anaerolineaceae bacterium]|nr:hypothetical protein [Anaerolineaceae bacterium]
MANVSRRTVLKGSALLGGGAFLSFNQIFGFSRVLGQDMKDDDTTTIINLASTAELFATTHYLGAINGASALGLDAGDVAYLKAAFIAEQDHLELLQSLGAKPVVTEFYVPEKLFSDKALFAAVSEVAETAFVGAYLAATRAFSNAGAPQFAVTAAQIAAVEAEHRMLVRDIGGSLPNNISYAQYTLHNVSDAVPVLQPFLDGKPADDSLGKFIGPVMPPTADDIAKIRAEANGLKYDTTVKPYAAIAAAMEPAATTDAMASGTCMVTASSAVNIRSDASTDSSSMGSLGAGKSMAVDGMKMGADGKAWYRLSGGGFVRSDVVKASGDCTTLPSV